MSHTIQYSSSRAEVWLQYRKTWRRSLWRTQALLAVVLGGAWSIAARSVLDPESWLLHALLLFPLLVVTFACIPQLMFKRAERTLQVGPEGWSARIGKTTGSRNWSEVKAVTLEEHSIVIRSSKGNVLIVPRRAFANEAARQEFYEEVRSLWKRHGSKRR